MTSRISLSLRFDMRAPTFGSPSRELFPEALAMSEYMDQYGLSYITLSEHHGSDDGYNPSPMVLGGAIAARTRHARIMLGALIAPLHDPLRVAEDMAVLDNLSGGRSILVVAAGYVPSEFAMFGRDMKDRAKLVEEAVATLRAAWTGEPFEFRGRQVRVTPKPVQPYLPILLGGSVPAAARRAARIADGFVTHLPDLHRVYFDEATALGKQPQPFTDPGPGFVFVAEDTDSAWQQLAPHVMHEMNAYGKWSAEAGLQSSYHLVDSLEELKASGQYAVVTPEDCLALAERYGRLTFHPLMGGMPPALGWSSLKLFVDKVLPKLPQK